MVAVEKFFDEIDAIRTARAKELIELRAFANTVQSDVHKSLLSKSAIVISYAHWEGFYNECVSQYLSFLVEKGVRVQDVEWRLLVGVIRESLSSLRDRNFSDEAKLDFIDELKNSLECDFNSFSSNEIAASSNLNFEKLRKNFKLMMFDISEFQESRIRIDKELVGWRHGVAHGNDPDLSKLDISNHIEFALSQILKLADVFQWKILELS